MCKKCLKMRLLFAAGGFVVGALAGAGTVALVARKKIKKQEKEIESLLEEYNMLLNLERSRDDNCHAKIEEPKIVVHLDSEEDEATYNEMRAVISREGYGRIVPGQKPTLEELKRESDEDNDWDKYVENMSTVEDEQISIEDYENGEEGRDPHEISAEEFFEDQTFDKDQLTFYIEDETLCDSDDSVLDIDSYLGYNTFMETVQTIVRRSKNASGLIYWRNPDISCDFEIELRNMSYTATVLGVDDTERGGYKRSERRRQMEEEDE